MRLARLIAIAIVLGIATSVGVMWAIAATRSVPMYPRQLIGAMDVWNRPWQVSAVEGEGYQDLWWMDLHTDDPNLPTAELIRVARNRNEEQRARAQTSPRPGGPPGSPVSNGSVPVARDAAPAWGTLAGSPIPRATVIGSDTAFGWPMLCGWYQVTGALSGNTISTATLSGGILIQGSPSARGRDFHALPLQPIWSGAVLNTLFYAAVWALLLLGISAARRSWRRRHGCCTRCGYLLRGLDPGATCPECGLAHAR